MIDLNGTTAVQTGARSVIKDITRMTHIFDDNLQKTMTSEYEI